MRLDDGIVNSRKYIYDRLRGLAVDCEDWYEYTEARDILFFPNVAFKQKAKPIFNPVSH